MGRELQKKKNKSSTSRVKHKPKSKRVNIKSNPLIAAKWDQSLTLAQNYQKLGLTARLNGRTGGIERTKTDVPLGAISAPVSTDTLKVSSRLPTKIKPAEVNIERDPTTGAILRVIQHASNSDNPLNDPLSEATNISNDVEGRRREGVGTNNIVRELEMQASIDIKKQPRRQSKREEEWIDHLITKYGEDYEAMMKDRKLNPYQQSSGDLKRRAQKWKETFEG